MPGIQLCICQRIRKIFDDLFGNPGFLNRKIVGSFFIFFFHHLDGKDEQQKFIKNKTLPGNKQFFHAEREMNSSQCIINVCKLVTLSDIFRKKFTVHRKIFKKLPNRFGNGFIGKSACQAVDWLQAVQDLFVCCRGKNFRMFHLNPVLFFDDPST